MLLEVLCQRLWSARPTCGWCTVNMLLWSLSSLSFSHKYTHTHTNKHTHTYTHTHTHSHTYTHRERYEHTRTPGRGRERASAHARTHARTHTHTCICKLVVLKADGQTQPQCPLTVYSDFALHCPSCYTHTMRTLRPVTVVRLQEILDGSVRKNSSKNRAKLSLVLGHF